MADIVKPLGTEETATANTNVSLATLVRAFNSGAGVTLITMAYANAVTYATMTVASYSETMIRKRSTDTIQGTNLKVTKVA